LSRREGHGENRYLNEVLPIAHTEEATTTTNLLREYVTIMVEIHREGQAELDTHD
jgi:hypothetical protein